MDNQQFIMSEIERRFEQFIFDNKQTISVNFSEIVNYTNTPKKLVEIYPDSEILVTKKSNNKNYTLKPRRLFF